MVDTMIQVQPASTWEAWGLVLPTPGSDSCPLCHSWNDEPSRVCATCSAAQAELHTLAQLLPISLFAKPSLMRDALTEYKSAGGGRHAEALAALLRAFLDCHADAVVEYFGCAWDVVTPVPSTRGRLGQAVARVGQGAGLQVNQLLHWTGTVGQHRRYDLPLFAAKPEAEGRRVLLLEDAYVSGARSQTAAATLSSAGALAVGILALGRRVNPDFNDCSRLFWGRRASGSGSMGGGFQWLTIPEPGPA